MAMVKEAGTYLAKPQSWAVEHEAGKCPRFVMVFQCTRIRDVNEWIDVLGDERITGRFTLINKDESPNEINLRALRDALGWTDGSFKTLENSDWTAAEVQIVVDVHEYNDKKTLEVKYLNPRDYSGGKVEKADPQVVQSLDSKYSATVRALFGTKPANGNGKPAAAAKPVTSVDPAASTKQKAWEALVAKTPGWDLEKRKGALCVVIKDVCNKEPAAVTAKEWASIQEEIEKNFSAEVGALIPF